MSFWTQKINKKNQRFSALAQPQPSAARRRLKKKKKEKEKKEGVLGRKRVRLPRRALPAFLKGHRLPSGKAPEGGVTSPRAQARLSQLCTQVYTKQFVQPAKTFGKARISTSKAKPLPIAFGKTKIIFPNYLQEQFPEIKTIKTKIAKSWKEGSKSQICYSSFVSKLHFETTMINLVIPFQNLW